MEIYLAFMLVILGTVQNGNADLRVAAAADLSRAFGEIARGFESESAGKVTMVFGSTGLLAKQIESGAPFDVFAAADEKYLIGLEKKGMVAPHSRKLYATGRLVIVSRDGVRLPSSLKDLLSNDYRKIAVANPAHAPYGAAAEEALRNSGVLTGVQGKLVYGENIQQTVRYVESGAADAGIVSLSLVIGSNRRYTTVPENLYQPLRQAIALISGSKVKPGAGRFVDYVLSPKGRSILTHYGFLLPGDRVP